MKIEDLIAKAVGEIAAAQSAARGLPEEFCLPPAEMAVGGQVRLVQTGLKFGTEPVALVPIHLAALRALGVSAETAQALVRAVVESEPRG